MKKIWAVAKNTFKETVRDKLLYALLGFAVLVIAGSLLAGSVSLGQDQRVIEDFSLTAMLVFLLIITLFIGTQLVRREVERKTIYLSLTKPISRDQFYLGKFVGLCLTSAVSAVVMGTIFLIVLYLKTKSFEWVALWAIGALILEIWLLTAVSLLFSSFAAPIASAIYTFGLVLVGHSSLTIWSIAQKSGGFLKGTLEAVYYVFPNLEKFNLRNEVVYHLHPNPTQTVAIILYFVGYTVAVLLLGMSVFRRHEF
ncbi:MAG TPA: ABC transporter permease subunit [Candidatus Saccharimonadales bacterium]|nr:ABC transporter permease subunit [Candidatus Saccharimonadales bacterium]